MIDYKNKKVTVVGLARSGIQAVRLLNSLGAEVSVTDNSRNPALISVSEEFRAGGINVELGCHTIDFFSGRDFIVVSPGVNNDSLAIEFARRMNIPVISEIELAWSVCRAAVIAVTGTNGKTTVTTLIKEVLKAGGLNAVALGNIGMPFSGCVNDLGREDYVSLEVSSFQLEKINTFKPRVAVMLNFAPNHLDNDHRGHNDIWEYLDAKKRIFMNQDEDDYLVLNEDDPIIRSLSKEARPKVIYFSALSRIRSTDLWLNHNHLAVMAAASVFGIPESLCLEVFRNFKGIEHRMEYLPAIKGVDFINDSKSTNIDSTVWALNNISKPVILIAGGKDKGIDYSLIKDKDVLKGKVKMMILVGEVKDKFAGIFKGVLPLEQASSMEEAVKISYDKAKEGDCVLLSPMCSSFDMFNDYEHRGRVFKEVVSKLGK